MKRNIYLIYAIAFLQGLVFYAPVSLLFRTQRGLSAGEFFLLEFLLLLIVVATEVPWGYFADRYGYKKTLIMSYSLFFISRVSLLFCHGFFCFLGETILKAIAISAGSGCDIAFIYNACEEKESEKVFGRYSAIGSLAFLISAISYYCIVDNSIELGIMLTIISYGISVILMCFTKDISVERSNKKESINITKCFKQLKYMKYIVIFVISTTLVTEMAYGISMNLGQLHFEDIGLDIRYFGFISAMSEVLGMLSCKTHVLSNKFGQNKVLKSILLTMLICACILIFTNSIFISIICICSISGLISMTFPIITDIKNKSINENRATMLSIYSMMGNIVSSIFYIAIGFCADIYLKYAFMFCFTIMTVGVYGVFFYINKGRVKVNTN